MKAYLRAKLILFSKLLPKRSYVIADKFVNEPEEAWNMYLDLPDWASREGVVHDLSSRHSKDGLLKFMESLKDIYINLIIFSIIIKDALTDFTNGGISGKGVGRLLLQGNQHWGAATRGDTISFVYNDGIWIETNRSDNT